MGLSKYLHNNHIHGSYDVINKLMNMKLQGMDVENIESYVACVQSVREEYQKLLSCSKSSDEHNTQ